MTTGIINDQNMEKTTEKHMGGCIAGFFHFFDRNHVISGKRLHQKRLPAYTGIESESGFTSSVTSPAVSREFELPKPREQIESTASSDYMRSPAVPETPPPVKFEYKEVLKSPSKFPRDLPRLSLDSRLHPRGVRTNSAAGGRCDGGDDESDTQRRSPSVVARLMGLEPLRSSQSGNGDMTEKKVELRRSASESRSRDLLNCNILPAKAEYRASLGFAASDSREKSNGGGYIARNAHPEQAQKPRRVITQQQQRKGLYDYGDYFPELKPTVSSIYGDVEKRLKMRGIEDSSRDLETLKQILESLHLKGLLHHSKPPASQIGRRNIVYERRFPYEESPIIVMKPMRSPRRLATEPSPPRFQSKTSPRRNLNLNITNGDSFSSPSPRINPNPTSPGRIENRTRSKVASLNIETQRTLNETTSMEARRVSPIQSPRIGSRRLDQTVNQSQRRRKSTAEIRPGRAEDELSTISESSFSTSSRTDTEKSKVDECYKDGKSLIERCNKLLNSIAEMNSTNTESQQSPVSVLDSSLYKEEESPSPVKKRAIDFKDMEDEIWSSLSSGEDEIVDNQRDPDFAYVSEIIRALNSLPGDTDIFSLLEKKQSIKRRDTSKSSRLQRKLIFDTITEILDQNKQLPPWKSVSCGPQLSEIWSELQRLQKRDKSDDMFEVICEVMKRDMTRDSINGWRECQLELSDTVVNVEKLIFKDLIGETIRDLGKFDESSAPRRKLVF